MTIFHLPLSIENLGFIVYVAFNRIRLRLLSDSHPSSAPLITGDSFRKIANHIFDSDQKFKPGEVNDRDIVFVSLPKLSIFFKEIHPNIKHKYILITHNGDEKIGKSELKFLDQKIIHWFSQNVLISHRKITPIPIGIENLSYFNHGIPELIKKSGSRPVNKKLTRILAGFSLHTNMKERKNALHALTNHKYIDTLKSRLNSFQYFNELSKYKFVISPPGNGPDCIRTWEACYCKTVPIVLNDVGMQSLKKRGLPIWIINEWQDLTKYAENDLKQIYQKIRIQANPKTLNFKYWQDLIESYQ